MSLQGLCKDRVDVEYPTYTKVNGARKPTFNVRYTAEPCRVQLKLAKVKNEYGRDSQRLEGMVYFPRSLTLKSNDRLKFGTRYLEVFGNVDIDEWGRLTHVQVREVKA